VDVADVQRLFLRQFKLRIEPEMARYVLRHMNQGTAAPPTTIATIAATLPVMGADARTGVPLRQFVAPQDLRVSSAV
jgi:hypothetical protein